MSYEIEYDTTDVAKAEAKAIKDCKQWLGVKQFNKVTKILKEDKGRAPRSIIRAGLSFQGIQGYPAEVMIDKYWSPQMELDLK